MPPLHLPMPVGNRPPLQMSIGQMEGESGNLCPFLIDQPVSCLCPLVIDHPPFHLPMPVKWREHRANVHLSIGQMEGVSGNWWEQRANVIQRGFKALLSSAKLCYSSSFNPNNNKRPELSSSSKGSRGIKV